MAQGNKFKGTDRDILKKTKFMLEAIRKRDLYLDALTAIPLKKSSRVSNRIRIIPAIEPIPSTGITAAIAVLEARIDDLLSQTW